MVTHISSSTDIGKMLTLVPRKLPASTNAFPGRGDSVFVPAIVLTTWVTFTTCMRIDLRRGHASSTLRATHRGDLHEFSLRLRQQQRSLGAVTLQAVSWDDMRS